MPKAQSNHSGGAQAPFQQAHVLKRNQVSRLLTWPVPSLNLPSSRHATSVAGANWYVQLKFLRSLFAHLYSLYNKYVITRNGQ